MLSITVSTAGRCLEAGPGLAGQARTAVTASRTDVGEHLTVGRVAAGAATGLTSGGGGATAASQNSTAALLTAM